MTRRSYQQGYVSDPVRTRRGTGFRIRYRVRTAKGKWKHKSELLYGLNGKKAARAVLNARLQAASNQRPEAAYESVLKIHIVPTLGEMRLVDLAPVHIEELLHAKAKAGLVQRPFEMFWYSCRVFWRWQ